MPWTHQAKKLPVRSKVDHDCATANVVGRAPGISTLHFTPLEFFGAAARCSHMQYLNPALVTPESLMIAALVEQYVDDLSSDFAILPTANNFKDFIKSYFVGTVAAGLAYLAMIGDGYSWADHFENVVGGNIAAGRSPDFVFAGNGIGIALVESKGTRSAGKGTFDSTVEAGYLGQVEPHLGHVVNGVFATHGYCVGSWLTSTTKAEMLIHHTAKSVSVPVSGGAGAPPTKVQQHNYATAFQLVQGREMGAQLRQGLVHDVLPFFRFRWLDRQWLTTFQPALPWLWRPSLPTTVPQLLRSLPPGIFTPPFATFAIEENSAQAVLRHFSRTERADRLEISPLPSNLIEMVRGQYQDEPAAVFPDGLAVTGWKNRITKAEIVRWDAQGSRFTGAT